MFVVGSCLLVAACSSSTGATPAGSSGSASGAGQCGDGKSADFCGHIKISGGYTVEADFRANSVNATSCTEWLKGKRDDATMLTLPQLLTDPRISTDAVVEHYKGPGSYSVADLIGNLGGFQIVVDHDEFRSATATAATAVVNGDGSGTLNATGMQPAGDVNKVKVPVDVVMTWTCVMKP
jgi:hypothetical protein